VIKRKKNEFGQDVEIIPDSENVRSMEIDRHNKKKIKIKIGVQMMIG